LEGAARVGRDGKSWREGERRRTGSEMAGEGGKRAGEGGEEREKAGKRAQWAGEGARMRLSGRPAAS
jgi:hypothetical protein